MYPEMLAHVAVNAHVCPRKLLCCCCCLLFVVAVGGDVVTVVATAVISCATVSATATCETTFILIFSPLPKELTVDLPYREKGDFDEQPAHKVSISKDFYASSTEVTNKQFEMFNASHKVNSKVHTQVRPSPAPG